MSDKQVFDYPGSEIDVHWDGRLCIHMGECGGAAGSSSWPGASPGASRIRPPRPRSARSASAARAGP